VTNETTENFLQIMATFAWPDPEPVTYKLYYNDDGTPKCYSMEDLPGKYILVDKEIYVLAPWNVQVVEGQVHIIQPAVQVKKLCPGFNTGTPCHTLDVCVVVGADQPHTKWNTVTNEIR
jgi:hypothetical protein